MGNCHDSGGVYSGGYPVRAETTDHRIRNRPEQQQQPFYTGQRSHRTPSKHGGWSPERQVQSAPRDKPSQTQQKPTASVQPYSKQKPEDSPPNQRTSGKSQASPEDLKYYIELEMSVRQWEAKGIGNTVRLKQEQLLNLEKALVEIRQRLQTANKRIDHEKADDADNLQPPSVREFLEEQALYAAQMTQEQEEYLEALNVREMLEKEEATTVKQIDNLSNELQPLKDEEDEMNDVYRKHDELLHSLFQGTYGSELENELELELDSLIDIQERISMAKTRWNIGLLLLRYANQQLAFSLQRWNEVSLVNATQTVIRWQYATETRNNLLAALQNTTSAQRYLNAIVFPYCKPEELVTLGRAIANIYADLLTPERMKLARKCYTSSYRTCAVLMQWFDAVISGTIMVELDAVTEEVRQKTAALRLERLRLMKAMCSQSRYPEINKIINEAELLKEVKPKVSDEADDGISAVPDQADLAVQVIGLLEGDSVPTADSAVKRVTAPAPLSPRELAPPPRYDILFENIEEIKKEHDERMKEFRKAQSLNKALQEQGLPEKLAVRRHRKAD